LGYPSDLMRMLEEPNIYNSQIQVLSTEAENKDKSGKALKEKARGSHKDSKVKSSSETHVELDSRLLSALLTVSISLFILCQSYSI
jgi:hypothetical protein